MRLAVRILHLLGEEGPKMPNPTRYIRYIYNRTILENSPVRAAAVSALAKFAAALDGEIRESVQILLNRCLDDPDDEVRDRAVMYLKIIEVSAQQDRESLMHKYVLNDSTFAMTKLEDQLVSYLNSGEQKSQFDLKMIPIVTRAQEKAEQAAKKSATAQFAQSAGLVVVPPASSAAGAGPNSAPGANGVAKEASAVEKIPQFASFGPVFRSSKPVDLTEADVAEYVVSCIKHMFKDHIVFQFYCRNTLDDVLLEKVEVAIETTDNDLAGQLKPVAHLPIDKLPFDTPQSAFIAFQKVNGQAGFPVGSFTTCLKFISKDCDPNTGEPDEEGFEDTYQMEEVELNFSDYMMPSYASSFKVAWEEVGAAHENVETFQLSAFNNIKDAIQAIRDILDMAPCEGSDQLPADRVNTITSHILLLSGIFVGGVRCLVRVRMACVSSGVTMEMTVRSDRADISQLVTECIG